MNQGGSEACEVSGAAIAVLLAWIWGAGQIRAGVERPGGARRNQGAGGDGTRSPGLRVGSAAISRDGVDAGRLRCDSGLAAAECAGEHGERRVLGVDS